MFFLLHPAASSSDASSSTASSAIINTSSSTHHLHNIINTTPSTLHHQKQHHQHNIINTTPSRQHHQHNTIINTPSTQHHQHYTIYTAGAALGAPQCGKCSMRSTSIEVCGSPATIEYCGGRLRLRGRHSTWSTSVSFCVAGAARGAPAERERSAEVRRRLSTVDAGCVCVAGAALGAPQSHFAWQAQHLEHLSFAEHLSLILRGRCSTQSTSREVCGSPATIEHCGRRLRLRGTHSTWSTSVSFCVAGAALGAPQFRGAPQSHFAWQVQHAEHSYALALAQPSCPSAHLHISIYTTPATSST